MHSRESGTPAIYLPFLQGNWHDFITTILNLTYDKHLFLRIDKKINTQVHTGKYRTPQKVFIPAGDHLHEQNK
jgi:hypothetical protein